MGDLSDIENREQIQPAGDWELIPDGTYRAAVVAREIKPTRKGDGTLLQTTHMIFEEGASYDGRELKTYFNIKSPNPKAQQIGLGKLAALCKACGLPGIPEDSSDIIEKFHYIVVGLKPGEGVNPKTGDPYGPSNYIKSYKPLSASLKTGPAKDPAEKVYPPGQDISDDLPDFLK